MTYTIREECKRDRPAVATLLKTAFGHPGEAELVAALHKGGHVVLSLVATVASAGLVGQVLFSRVRIEGNGAGSQRGTALAPLAVLPASQGRGIGSALVRHGLARLKETSEELCFVLGAPDFYRRFGFDTHTAAGFDCAYAGPHFMAAWLQRQDAGLGTGRIVYPEPFADLA